MSCFCGNVTLTIAHRYTDHAPFGHAGVSTLALLQLANQYGVSRLVTLCELYLSKGVWL